eukprot:6916825-Alexandrium_andersonii.AAC.1
MSAAPRHAPPAPLHLLAGTRHRHGAAEGRLCSCAWAASSGSTRINRPGPARQLALQALLCV